MEKIIAIIPARMGSSRFPGKPMIKIRGIPMIGRVYKNVKKCKKLDEVVVATCDKIIFDYIISINGKAIMTSKKHKRASDRCAEALLKIEKNNNIKYGIVVMVQGDEPLINSSMIINSFTPMLKDKSILVTNLLGKINSIKELEDRNSIKVVCDKKMNAIYFSREPIPTRFNNKNKNFGKQVCVIPFRRTFLLKYLKMKPTTLEKIESIDMLRIIENGFKVKMIRTNAINQSVDTPSDLKKIYKYLN